MFKDYTIFRLCKLIMVVFSPLQLVQAPPTKLGLPSLQSIIKEHNRRTSQGPEAEQEEDVESEEDTEDEADVSMYEKKVGCDLIYSFNMDGRSRT